MCACDFIHSFVELLGCHLLFFLFFSSFSLLHVSQNRNCDCGNRKLFSRRVTSLTFTLRWDATPLIRARLESHMYACPSLCRICFLTIPHKSKSQNYRNRKSVRLLQITWKLTSHRRCPKIIFFFFRPLDIAQHIRIPTSSFCVSLVSFAISLARSRAA